MNTKFSIEFRINNFYLQAVREMGSGKELDSDPCIDGFFRLTAEDQEIGFILDEEKNMPDDLGSDNILCWFRFLTNSFHLLKKNRIVYMVVPDSYNQFIRYEHYRNAIKFSILTSECMKIPNIVGVNNLSKDVVEKGTAIIEEEIFTNVLKTAYANFYNVLTNNNPLLSTSKILCSCADYLVMSTY
jgi:hypothetical protein